MDDMQAIERAFRRYIEDLGAWLPEGVIDVDLLLLQRFELINYQPSDVEIPKDPALTRYFHVIETQEKITLINDQFVVWIVPEKMEEVPITYTLIALNTGDEPQLEMVFATSGVYNSSHLVLRVLEKFLEEIQENEALIQKFTRQR